MSVDPVSLGIKVALTAASIGLQMLNKTEGPRLDTLDVSLADYGTPIRRFWGIRRLEGCPIIWAEKLRESKVESKGKGGKYESYKYHGTWANLICDHPIDAIRRVWMDKHLVYQAKDAGPVAPLLGLGSNDGTLMGKIGIYNKRVYLGTEDQMPDPRMESWCEDRYGPDSCPAYRGVSYIVFQDIPLEKFGNRIPQLTIEAISQATPAYLSSIIATDAGSSSDFCFDTAGGWMAYRVAGTGGQIEWYDQASRTRISRSASPGYFSSLSTRPSQAADGTAYQVGPVSPSGVVYLAVTRPATNPEMVVADPPYLLFDCTRVLENSTGRHVLSAYGLYAGSSHSGWLSYTDHVDHLQSARDFCLNGEGQICVLLHPTGASSSFTLRIDGTEHTLTGTARSGPTTAYMMHVSTYHHYLVITDGHFYLIDDQTFTIKASGVAPFSAALEKNNAEQNPGLLYIRDSWKRYSLEDLTLAQDDSSHSGDFGVETSQWGFDTVNNALWGRGLNTTDPIKIAYFDRVGSDGVTLGSIVDDVAGWCGIVVDAVALDQIVYGYSVVQGTGKDMIAPLLDMHDSDCRPHDFTIQFIKRGGSSARTIETADFVREGDESRYTVSIAQDTDLPRRLSVNFADLEKDQQTNTCISQRPLDSVDGVREQSIDLTTYVTTPAEAQQLSDRRFRRLWNERESIDNALTMNHLGLEPGDVVTLSLDGAERNARLDKLTISQGRLKCTFKRDALTLAGLNSSQGATMDGRDEETIYIPGPAKGIVLETPYLSDNEVSQTPLLHYAAGTYGQSFNFPGAIIYKSDLDDNEFSEWNGVESQSKATWGYVSGTLNNCDPWIWDRASSVSVDTYGAALTSSTEAAINADPTINQAIIGSEVVNFATATLETDGTYTLSGFKRGRRGTEWACSGHATGETFVLASSLQSDGYGLSEVGLTESFKAQMVGRDPNTAAAESIALAGSTLKPYAPARLKWAYNGSDLVGTITRRTRVGGSWVGGSTIPLSENSEAYEVEIYNGSTLKRTISVSGTNTFSYSAAMAAADGLSLSTPPTARVYQMSDAVGRGYALAA